MIVGDTFERISVRHINFDPQEIINASLKVVETVPRIAASINDMKAIELEPDEKGVFARAAHELLNDDPKKASYPAESLLAPRRGQDAKDDLWSTFNIVQENIMKGRISGYSKTSGRRTMTRPVKSIDRNIRLNRALWTLAEEMKTIKQQQSV